VQAVHLRIWCIFAAKSNGRSLNRTKTGILPASCRLFHYVFPAHVTLKSTASASVLNLTLTPDLPTRNSGTAVNFSSRSDAGCCGNPKTVGMISRSSFRTRQYAGSARTHGRWRTHLRRRSRACSSRIMRRKGEPSRGSDTISARWATTLSSFSSTCPTGRRGWHRSPRTFS
jgi:hypothetical protein